MVSTSIIFCTASIAVYAINTGCSSWDLVGRYVVPLVIALPFIIGAVFTIPAMILDTRNDGTGQGGDENQDIEQRARYVTAGQRMLLKAVQVGLLVVVACYFFSQGVAYDQADARNTFQGTGCISANPTDQSPIINYMQQEKMHYAWATGWLGDPITFKSNGTLIVTELPGRIQANGRVVFNADRPGIFFLAPHDDLHPAILKALDDKGITYHIERFYSVPGVDLLLVVPLNLTVSPFDPAFRNLFRAVFRGCVAQ